MSAAITSGVTAERAGSVGIVRTSGYLNVSLAEQAEARCRQFLEAGCRALVLNLSGSTLINSMGWSVLIGVIEQAQEHAARVIFCALDEVNAQTFEIMGLELYAGYAPTEVEALRLASEEKA
jgi:anti-anti-sigma factor